MQNFQVRAVAGGLVAAFALAGCSLFKQEKRVDAPAAAASAASAPAAVASAPIIAEAPAAPASAAAPAPEPAKLTQAQLIAANCKALSVLEVVPMSQGAAHQKFQDARRKLNANNSFVLEVMGADKKNRILGVPNKFGKPVNGAAAPTINRDVNGRVYARCIDAMTISVDQKQGDAMAALINQKQGDPAATAAVNSLAPACNRARALIAYPIVRKAVVGVDASVKSGIEMPVGYRPFEGLTHPWIVAALPSGIPAKDIEDCRHYLNGMSRPGSKVMPVLTEKAGDAGKTVVAGGSAKAALNKVAKPEGKSAAVAGKAAKKPAKGGKTAAAKRAAAASEPAPK